MSLDDSNIASRDSRRESSNGIRPSENSPEDHTSDTLLLVTSDRNLLFVTFDAQESLIVTKNINLSDTFRTLTYDYWPTDLDQYHSELQMNDYWNDLTSDKSDSEPNNSTSLKSSESEVAAKVKLLGKELACDFK